MMYPVQRFALESIYCAPSQDKQVTYKMMKVTKNAIPVREKVLVYNTLKTLPTKNDFYHVFTLGSIPPIILNLLKQQKEWYKDTWINFQEDMTERNYIAQFYGEDGVNYLRNEVYYSFIDQKALLIAIRFDTNITRQFNVEKIEFMRLYSNQYFNTEAFNRNESKLGIIAETFYVNNNIDKVNVQNKINTYKQSGGQAMIYVNGYLTPEMTLNIPDQSYIEVVYDQSIDVIEYYNISSMRTFISDVDSKIKYLLFRDKRVDYIEYQDDIDFYVSSQYELVPKGVYLYKHKEHTVRNVTDKDFSIQTDNIINLTSVVNKATSSNENNKQLILFIRKSADKRVFGYSSSKLHELYKLPKDKQLDVLLNSNYGITEFRAKELENSTYLKVASAKGVRALTNSLTTDALGYNGVTYFFGMTPSKVPEGQGYVDVPELYQKNSVAYEYNSQGLMTGWYESSGPEYVCVDPDTTFVEFIYGTPTWNQGSLYLNECEITLEQEEFRILSADFDNLVRITQWQDITDNTSLVTYKDNKATVKEFEDKKIKVVYFNQPLIYDLEIPTVDGILYFPLTVTEDRGAGVNKHLLDVPYQNVEIYLNGNRLSHDIDFHIKFPNVNICNKTYIDYEKEKQSIHIRCHGFALFSSDINKKTISGFINNGVLTRNNYYDIRDDRVFTAFVDGKIKDRASLLFSEEDSTVRLEDPLNGLPYTISENFIPIKNVTGLNTIPYYNKNVDLNNKISQLYNNIFKEPSINTFNVIHDHHYVFSPVVSKILHDMLDGNIPRSLYTNPYDDTAIYGLIDNNYKHLMLLDPIKYNMPDNLIEIHPHFGNDVVYVDIFQYRFITNVVRVITMNQSKKINLSGYLKVFVPE